MLVSLSVTMVRFTGVFADDDADDVDDEPLLEQPASTMASTAPAVAVNTAIDLADLTGFSRR
jgi:hypothetical protein